ncbi:MAG: hypothetical protein ACJAUP_000774 [Cellvibrionaceae bacterium]|jgi:hypothetical protein
MEANPLDETNQDRTFYTLYIKSMAGKQEDSASFFPPYPFCFA